MMKKFWQFREGGQVLQKTEKIYEQNTEMSKSSDKKLQYDHQDSVSGTEK